MMMVRSGIDIITLLLPQVLANKKGQQNTDLFCYGYDVLLVTLLTLFLQRKPCLLPDLTGLLQQESLAQDAHKPSSV